MLVRITAFLALGYVSVSCAVALPAHTFSLPKYIAELDRLSGLAGDTHETPSAGDTAISELRGGWKVEAEGKEFEVDTSQFVDEFEKLRSNPDPQIQQELTQQLDSLKQDAQQFEQPAPDSTSTRAALAQILARGEFHRVHGPTWLDQLKYRILRWLIRILSHLFGSASVPVIGKGLIWSLVALAVLVTAFFVYRAIKQGSRFEQLVPQVMPVSAKHWQLWMQEAQAAARKGQWREAIHLAYWAGISFLEQSGLWKPDKARTPREYIRLLPATSAQRASLATLTRMLELTWYGNQQASSESFAETVALLENLGCRQG